MMVAATRQVHGPESMGIVAATGCNTVFGSTYPFNPYLVPWTNSLFENAPGRRAGRSAPAGTRPATRTAGCGSSAATGRCTTSASRRCRGWSPRARTSRSWCSTRRSTRTPAARRRRRRSAARSPSSRRSARRSMGGPSARKELGRILMAHGDAYVAQTTPAHLNHFYRAVMEANAYPGPAVVIAYTPCMPEHGIADDAAIAPGEARRRLAGVPAVHLRPAPRRDASPSGCRCRATPRCATTGRRCPTASRSTSSPSPDRRAGSRRTSAATARRRPRSWRPRPTASPTGGPSRSSPGSRRPGSADVPHRAPGEVVAIDGRRRPSSRPTVGFVGPARWRAPEVARRRPGDRRLPGRSSPGWTGRSGRDRATRQGRRWRRKEDRRHDRDQRRLAADRALTLPHGPEHRTPAGRRHRRHQRRVGLRQRHGRQGGPGPGGLHDAQERAWRSPCSLLGLAVAVVRPAEVRAVAAARLGSHDSCHRGASAAASRSCCSSPGWRWPARRRRRSSTRRCSSGSRSWRVRSLASGWDRRRSRRSGVLLGGPGPDPAAARHRLGYRRDADRRRHAHVGRRGRPRPAGARTRPLADRRCRPARDRPRRAGRVTYRHRTDRRHRGRSARPAGRGSPSRACSWPATSATWLAALRRAPATEVTSILVVGAVITGALTASARGVVPEPVTSAGYLLALLGVAGAVLVRAPRLAMRADRDRRLGPRR